ncbi:unnamed protein product, partial [Mesorhabditis belari]|uniref:alpha-1,2-Mannosidase n=1 Tax=Mesorhabditis belari TaxID=2138241 RepID=A0AAF3J938_9BILA
MRLLRPTETLPLYQQDLDGDHARTITRIRRLWRSMPRYIRTVLPLFCLAAFFALVYALGSSLPTESIETNEADFQKFQRKEPNIPQDYAQPNEHVAGVDNSAAGVDESNGKSEEGAIKFTGPKNDRQKAVAGAFKHAWDGYKKYAWGHDQLKPQTRTYSDWFDTGLTITDALDTAIIMGLEDEVREGTEWIEKSLSFDKDRYVNLFEITIRVMGGLLTSFHLTGNKMFVIRAEDLADRLLGAFTGSKSPVPFSDVNLKTRAARGPSWSSESSLSEVSTLQMEFRDLSRITGNATFEKTAFKVSEHIHEIGCAAHDGLCEMFINANTGRFREKTTITFGARADSYYEYLLKQWVQTGKTIEWLASDYQEAMASMDKKMVRLSEPNKLLYVGELLPPSDSFSPKMDHLVCFLSGTLGLGAKNGMPPRHMEIAEGLAAACHAMYQTPTGLAPEIAYFNMNKEQQSDLSIKPLDAHCLLRPEAVEAWFYMYRFTGDKKYQDWGWEAFEAIEKYAKLDVGYSSVNSVKKIPVTYKNLMESFFLAETLKYLYLLFDDEKELIPLDKWVFNTEGHPLPIYKN